MFQNWVLRIFFGRAFVLAGICLCMFRVNGLVQPYLVEFDNSLRSIPLVWIAGAAIWLLMSESLFPAQRLAGVRENAGEMLRTWRNAVVWGGALYGGLVVLGARTTVSRWLGIILFVASISALCLLCSVAMGDAVRRFLRSRFWQLRVLGGLCGVMLCFLLVGTAELGCLLLPRQHGQSPEARNEGSYGSGKQFFTANADLGYSLSPSSEAGSRLVVGDRVVWDVTYTTDRFGRRTTVAPEIQSECELAVFFGCSFLFGEGSKDHQTIPSQFCMLATNWNAVNYGVPGWSAQHMLALLQSGRIPARLQKPAALGIYLYLPEVHEARVVGDMDIVNSFGQGFPCFELGFSQQVLRKGSFSSARPLTTLFYELMGKSHLRARLGLNFPVRNHQHYQLTAAVIRESAAVFVELFPESRFLLVVYPGAKAENKTVQICREAGIEVLNLQGLFDPGQVPWYFVGDGHPTPAANNRVAKAITEYLASRSSNVAGLHLPPSIPKISLQ